MADKLTIRDLLRNRLGVPTTPVHSGFLLLGTGQQTVLKGDPSRVSFIMVNTGAFPAFVLPAGGNPLTGTNGIRIEANGGALVTKWEDDGEMVAYEWFGFSVGGIALLVIVSNVIAAGFGAKAPVTGGV